MVVAGHITSIVSREINTQLSSSFSVYAASQPIG